MTLHSSLTLLRVAREEELVHVGNLYRETIKDDYLSAQSGQRWYPDRLEDLSEDSWHLVIRRYLLKLRHVQ